MRRSQRTITRADLADAVHRNLGLSRSASASMVQTVLEEVVKAVAQGEDVKLSGFGVFHVRQILRRVGRNPKTGEEVPIAPRRVVTFKPSQVIKRRVSGSMGGELGSNCRKE